MGQASGLEAIASDLNRKLVKLGVFRLLPSLDSQIQGAYLGHGAYKEMGWAEFYLDLV